MKCLFCDFETVSLRKLEAHDVGHTVKRVRQRPLVVLLTLPDGCCEGRWEAAEAFSDAVAKLREQYPGNRFHLAPFSSTLVGKDINVTVYLAVAEE